MAGHPSFGGSSAEWIANPDASGLADSFVPGQPSAGLICRYAALDDDGNVPSGTKLNGGELFSSTPVGAQDALALAATLNSIVPWDIGSGCLPTLTQARYTAIVFAIPDRTDVDLWLKDWYGCPEVGNGVRTSGLLINGQGDEFLIKLDSLAGRAPGQDP